MDIDKTKNLLTKISLTILGLSALALLAVLLLSPKKPPQKPPEPSPPELISPSPTASPTTSPASALGIPRLNILEKERENWRTGKTRVNFKFDSPNLEKKLMVYKKLSIDTPLTDKQARVIASRLGFSGIPKETIGSEGPSLEWQSGAKYVSINLKNKLVDYSVDRFSDQTVITKGKEISESEAKKAAEEFLKTNQLSNPYLDFPNSVVNYAGVDSIEEEPSPTAKKELAFLDIPLKINARPLLLTGLPSNYIKMVVSAKGIIISAKTRLYDAAWEEFKEVSLLALDKAKEFISRGGGLMVANSAGAGLSETLLSYELNQVHLAYYGKNEKEEYLQPLYIFAGKGVLEGDFESNVLVFLPAIEYR